MLSEDQRHYTDNHSKVQRNKPKWQRKSIWYHKICAGQLLIVFLGAVILVSRDRAIGEHRFQNANNPKKVCAFRHRFSFHYMLISGTLFCS